MPVDARTIDEILSAVARALPRSSEDLDRNVRAALASVLDRMELVTREELEVQEAVLARTRAQLKEMEERVATLERRLAAR
jgi:BMFP domain-containing protein YqiC